MAFQDFLKSEYSEENILFWLACEEYKKTTSAPEMISKANQIYTEFVQTEAPRQVKDWTVLNSWESFMRLSLSSLGGASIRHVKIEIGYWFSLK